MRTISLCMIVKNEEKVLTRCLESVRDFADEIVVCDTGSTDKTREIATNYGHVVDFAWCDDFSAARNFSFAHANGDYILWLDADDVVQESEKSELFRLKERLDGTQDVIMLPYHTAFDEQGKPVFTYFRERILRRAAGFRWEGAVHECITPRGNIVYGRAAVEHRPLGRECSLRNLNIYENLKKNSHKFTPREQFYYARELLTHERFSQAQREFEGFLGREGGWRENRIEACRGLAACLAGQGKGHDAKAALLRSFAEDMPRPSVCCELAWMELAENNVNQAIFWYSLALNLPVDEKGGAFVCRDDSGFTPCLGLCVCFDRLGKTAEAARWNERAAAFRPASAAVAFNRKYFAEKGESVHTSPDQSDKRSST